MKLIRGSKNLDKIPRSAVLTIGNFDGVHLGHQEIFRRVMAQAKKNKGTAVVYTFAPHPAKVVAPDESPLLIMTERQKTATIEACGIDICIVEDFTPAFAKMGADRFFEDVVIGRINPREIIVGHDLTFGCHRIGTTDLMDKLCKKHGIIFETVEAQLLDEVLLSSTHIRDLVSHGKVDVANKMLGRPFTLEGKVVHGRGIGGEIGIHTANLEVANELVPAPGVYVTRTLGKKSATNIGYNPTFGGSKLTIETHILNFVEFFKRLRAEMVFKKPEALKKQVEEDIRAVTEYFNVKK